MILCGVSDVRDYQIRSSSREKTVKGASAFNVRAKSLLRGDFSEGETRALLAQHTAETGREFGDGAAGRIWELIRGQPWLVNALAYEACFDEGVGRDRSRPNRVEAIDRAKETLILRRVTHFDQLAGKLREDRVRRVVMPMLAGSSDWDYTKRDLEYVRDLGLVTTEGPVRIANPMYDDVVPRELTDSLQSGLEGQVDPEWYVDEDRGLGLAGLLEAFQGYFREHAESWVERFGHKEAGPQLVLHAYLQRVVNSDRSIVREYPVGRGRSDLVIEWRRGGPGPAHTRKHVTECKVRAEKSGLERLFREGREQTAAYMDRSGVRAFGGLRHAAGQDVGGAGVPHGSGAGRPPDHRVGDVTDAGPTGPEPRGCPGGASQYRGLHGGGERGLSALGRSKPKGWRLPPLSRAECR